MAQTTRRRGFVILLLLAAAAVLFFLLRSSPLDVETARVKQGPMQVTVEEDGETRAHDRFVIAAPIPGRLLRMEWEEGDLVRQDATVAAIEPLPLNQQQREEVLARIEAAEATKRQANARLAHAQEDYAQLQRDLTRAELLAKENLLSVQALEQARNLEKTGAQELEAAKFSAMAAASEVKVASAGRLGMDTEGSAQKVIYLRSPVAGRVLRLVEKSERVVQAGAPLLILGDPAKIEIVTDVLTTDAVNIQRGASVYVEGWGGDHPIRARVRVVEPSGFTRISALGVEEKRVNVISDFVDSPNGLSDGFRVETRIVTWEVNNVLTIPGSAAFRMGNSWSVFVVRNGHALQKPVEVGHRNPSDVEVLSGLSMDDQVILHPSNQLKDGMCVRARRYATK